MQVMLSYPPPLQHRTVQGAAEAQGYALSVCEEQKMATNAASCRAVGDSFIPLAIESLVGWSELGTETINHIGRLLGQRLGIYPSTTTVQCLCGEGMVPYGCIASLLFLRSLTALSDSLICFCLFCLCWFCIAGLSFTFVLCLLCFFDLYSMLLFLRWKRRKPNGGGRSRQRRTRGLARSLLDDNVARSCVIMHARLPFHRALIVLPPLKDMILVTPLVSVLKSPIHRR